MIKEDPSISCGLSHMCTHTHALNTSKHACMLAIRKEESCITDTSISRKNETVWKTRPKSGLVVHACVPSLWWEGQEELVSNKTKDEGDLKCGGLSESTRSRLLCLNAWAPGGGSVWEGLGSVASLQEVCHFEVSSHTLFAVHTLLPVCVIKH